MPSKISNPSDGRALGALAGIATGSVVGWTGTAKALWPGATLKQCLLAVIHGNITPGGNFLPVAGGIVLGLAAGAVIYKGMTRPHEIHHRGRKLVSPRKMRRGLRPRGKQIPSVPLPGNLTFPIDQECRHIMIAGSPGGGKTVALSPVINAAAQRGDNLLVFSFKNDFQELWQGPFSLLAPWDSRSSMWVMGEDIATRPDAISLAETLIPTPEKDPIWAQGAQSLLVGVVMDLQEKRPGKWTATDLAKRLVYVCSDFGELEGIMRAQNPTALMYLKGGETSRTTASFLSNLAGGIEPIIDMGVAQASGQGELWSVRRWLRGETPRTAIIGFSQQNDRLAKRWASSLVEQATRQILDMPDTSPENRRIWFFLDETPQMGKIPSITQTLVTGRSKGLRVVLGIQSVAQLRQLYGKEDATTWESSTATKFIAQVNGSEDQKWASNLVGEREIERFQRTTQSRAMDPNSGGRSDQYAWVREPVLMPSEFSARLGPGRKGVDVLVLHDDMAAIIHQPFINYPKQRIAIAPAPWTKPGYKRENWGKIPPVIATPEPPMPADDEEKKKRTAAEQGNQEIVQLDQQGVHDHPIINAAVGLAAGMAGIPTPFSDLATRMLGGARQHQTPAYTPPLVSSTQQDDVEDEFAGEEEEL